MIQYFYGKSSLNHLSDKLCLYRATQPIQTQLSRYNSANNDDVIFFSSPYKHDGHVLIYNSKIRLINKIVINQVFCIGPVTGPLSAVMAHGPRPRANTADLGPVTWPIRNYLINNIIIFCWPWVEELCKVTSELVDILIWQARE